MIFYILNPLYEYLNKKIAFEIILEVGGWGGTVPPSKSALDNRFINLSLITCGMQAITWGTVVLW